MSLGLTRTAMQVFDPLTIGGAPRGADMAEARLWGTELETYIASLGAVDVVTIGGNYTVTNADKSRVIIATGGIPTVTFGSVTANSFPLTYINQTDAVTKLVGVDAADVLVFPGWLVHLFRHGGVWRHNRPSRYRPAAPLIHTDWTVGNDANDGLVSTRPKKSWTAALDYVAQHFDCGGVGPTVKELATNGSAFTSQVFTRPILGYHAAYLEGTPGTPSAQVMNAGTGHVHMQVRDGCILIISGFKLENSGTFGQGLRAGHGGILDIGNIEHGAMASGIHIFAEEGGHIGFVSGAACSISGNATYHMYATDGANINALNAAYTIPTARAFSIFAYAEDGGRIKMSGTTFSGAGFAGTTGQRFLCDGWGVVRTGGNVNLFPGNVAGAAANGATTGGGAAYARGVFS